MAYSVPPPFDPGSADVLPVRRNGALAYPLPAGLRDLMPVEAHRQLELGRAVLACFQLHGYELVSTPPFEYAHVLEHEVGAADAAKVVRFVEPETGEVLAFRPDITPQIARVVATRLADAPLPARLCYQGAVVRRRQERARRGRQLQQAGIELVGLPGAAGDLETLRVACDAVRAAGLTDFTVDLGHAMITSSLLGGARPEAREGIVEALSTKDADGARRLAEEEGLSGRVLAALAEVPLLFGGLDVLERAASLFAGTPAEPYARELTELALAVSDARLAPNLVVDVGETSTFSYYTGFMMRVLAHGPGEAVASGGRYDQLYDRFGESRSAAGAAIDIGNLAWALAHAGRQGTPPGRVLVAPDIPDRERVLAELRARGVTCAWAPVDDPAGYAAAWRYKHVLAVRDGRFTLTTLPAGGAEVLEVGGTAALADRVATVLDEGRLRQGV